ncbi:MAG: hypothetical protein K0R78_3214 [Pelosinus sp.]|nr:hypothetical protein [Pelosinus sp.]
MSKINWKLKLTSRKFWVSIVGLAMSIMVLTNTDVATQTQVAALIMAAASVVAYTVGEGLVDASRTTENKDTTDKPE